MNRNNKLNMKKVITVLVVVMLVAYGVSGVIFAITRNNEPEKVSKDKQSNVKTKIVYVTKDSKEPKEHEYKVNDSKSSSINGIDKINIDVSRVKLTFGNKTGGRIETFLKGTVNTTEDFKMPKIKCYTSENTLNISLNDENNNISGSYESNVEMKITIPNSYKNNIELKAADGEVSMSNYKLKRFDCRVSQGKLDINNITADEINYTNSQGGITASNIKADSLNFQSQEGSVDLDGFRGNTLIYHNSEGTFKGSNIITQSTKLNSQMGKISITDFTGNLDTNNSAGETEIEYSKFDNNVTAVTQAGLIKLDLPSSAKFNLDASTTIGKIDCDFPIKGSGEGLNSSVKGEIGNSSNKVKLTSTVGSISIAKH